MIWDVTALTAVRALDGLAERGRVRANNIANSETPNFRASTVDFESALRDAVRQGRPEVARSEVTAAPTVMNGAGNSVDLETELISSMQDGAMRDTMIAGFNFKAAQLRVAFGGRR